MESPIESHSDSLDKQDTQKANSIIHSIITQKLQRKPTLSRKRKRSYPPDGSSGEPRYLLREKSSVKAKPHLYYGDNGHDLIMINCHHCQKVKTIEQMLTCSTDSCRESYCFNCIRNARSAKLGEMKESQEYQRWMCYKCRNCCVCCRCSKNKSAPTILIEQAKKRKYRRKKRKFQFKQSANKNNKKTFKKRKHEQIIQITNLTVVNNFEIIELMTSNREIHSINQDMNTCNINTNDYVCYNQNLYANIISNCENKFNMLNNTLVGMCNVCKRNFYCGNELLVFDSEKMLKEYIEGVLKCKREIVLFESTTEKLCDIDKVDMHFASRKIVCKICFLKIINVKGYMSVFRHFLHDETKENIKMNKELVNNKTGNIKQLLNTSIVNKNTIIDKSNGMIHKNYSKVISTNSKDFQKKTSNTRNANKNETNANMCNVNNSSNTHNKTKNLFNSVFSTNSHVVSNGGNSYRESSLKVKPDAHNSDKHHNTSNTNNTHCKGEAAQELHSELNLNGKGVHNKNTQLMNYGLEMLIGLHIDLRNILKRVMSQMNGIALLNKDKVQEEIKNLNKLNSDYINIKYRYNQLFLLLEQLIQTLVNNCSKYLPANENNFDLLKEELRNQVIAFFVKKQQFEQLCEKLGFVIQLLVYVLASYM